MELYQPSKSQYVDAYSKLVGTIIYKSHGSIKMTSQVLSIVVLVIAQKQEKLGTQFNQKPFLKLLSSLFIELNNVNDDKESFVSVYGYLYKNRK